MARHREDDREEIDRAFAELVSGYHLTADRPDPLPATPSEQPDPAWADHHPLFRFAEAPPAPEPAPAAEPRYVPDPLPPLSRPGLPALLGWGGIVFACLAVLLTAFGVPLPSWVGWLAVTLFVVGFAVLLTRLPRNRPPDAGDGAVV